MLLLTDSSTVCYKLYFSRPLIALVWFTVQMTCQPKNLSFSELESFYQTSIGVLFAKLFNLTTVSDPRKGSLSKIQKYLRDFIELIKVVSCCELIYVLVNRIKILKFVSIHFITTQVTFLGKHSYPVGEHQIIFFHKHVMIVGKEF